jgi:hypothetical protein
MLISAPYHADSNQATSVLYLLVSLISKGLHAVAHHAYECSHTMLTAIKKAFYFIFWVYIFKTIQLL